MRIGFQLEKSNKDTPSGERWITIHPGDSSEGKHKGKKSNADYRRILIKDNGTIVAGDIPRDDHGKNIDDVFGDSESDDSPYEDYSYGELNESYTGLKQAYKEARHELRNLVHDTAEYLQELDEEKHGGNKDFVRQIRKVGGIKSPKRGKDTHGTEYHESVDADIRRAIGNKNGLPLDEVADELGMTSDELIQKLANASSGKKTATMSFYREAEKEIERQYGHGYMEKREKELKELDAELKRLHHAMKQAAKREGRDLRRIAKSLIVKSLSRHLQDLVSKGDAHWVTVKDEHSPLDGRHLLIGGPRPPKGEESHGPILAGHGIPPSVLKRIGGHTDELKHDTKPAKSDLFGEPVGTPDHDTFEHPQSGLKMDHKPHQSGFDSQLGRDFATNNATQTSFLDGAHSDKPKKEKKLSKKEKEKEEREYQEFWGKPQKEHKQEAEKHDIMPGDYVKDWRGELHRVHEMDKEGNMKVRQLGRRENGEQEGHKSNYQRVTDKKELERARMLENHEAEDRGVYPGDSLHFWDGNYKVVRAGRDAGVYVRKEEKDGKLSKDETYISEKNLASAQVAHEGNGEVTKHAEYTTKDGNIHLHMHLPHHAYVKKELKDLGFSYKGKKEGYVGPDTAEARDVVESIADKGKGEKESEKDSVVNHPEEFEDDVLGRKVRNGKVVAKNGKEYEIASIEPVSSTDRIQAEKAGISDPVYGMPRLGKTRLILPRAVAEKALEHQRSITQNKKSNMGANVKGYAELKEAKEQLENKEDKYKESIERGDVLTDNPSELRAKVQGLAKKYPRAALYLKAQSYTRAANDKKSSAGEEAMKKIRRGAPLSDAKEVLDSWHLKKSLVPRREEYMQWSQKEWNDFLNNTIQKSNKDDSKCDKFKNADGTFKNGFQGAVDYFKCKGMSEKEAKGTAGKIAAEKHAVHKSHESAKEVEKHTKHDKYGDGKKEVYAVPETDSYPLTKDGKPSEERTMAAWRYIHEHRDEDKLSHSELKRAERKIKAFAKKHFHKELKKSLSTDNEMHVVFRVNEE